MTDVVIKTKYRVKPLYYSASSTHLTYLDGMQPDLQLAW